MSALSRQPSRQARGCLSIIRNPDLKFLAFRRQPPYQQAAVAVELGEVQGGDIDADVDNGTRESEVVKMAETALVVV